MWEIENKGKRCFLISVTDHVSGGIVIKGPNNEDKSVSIEPGATVLVSDNCGKKLSIDWKNEIKVVKKPKKE